jgi:nicotinamidase-related amidase
MNAKSIRILSVDFQKDFTAENGIHYKFRPSVTFVKNTLIPYLSEKKIHVAEIISDYRQPRPGRKGDFCKPGTDGYESELPNSIKLFLPWIKAANSPLWTRENAGNKDKKPGLPYEDPVLFTKWLDETIGEPDTTRVAIIGLTLDRCVLSTAHELYMRGYEVLVLEEATDPYTGDQSEKETLLRGSIVNNWSHPILWEVLKRELSY